MFIHQYIEANATQQPDAVALRFKDKQYTYAQLNQRANQLACYLNAVGVNPEDRVAVCLEPSLDIAISLLGVFKAGGVYVPLDPSYPADRLSIILEDNRPRILITQSHLLPSLPVTSEHVFCIDQDWATIQHLTMDNPENKISLAQTAYIIYTSGTTGTPKGVMTSHSNLIHYILVAQDQYGFNRQDIMPAIARFTFSITMFELLSPLVAGGTLVILERDHILDFRRMVQTLEEVTVIHTSPSLMRALLAYIKEKGLTTQQFQGLIHVSTGGDFASVDLLVAMKTVFSNAEIYVIYGCTEVSCMGCTYLLPKVENITKSLVGKPFKNVSTRLYDPSQNLVPLGTTGEIYIGGSGVAQGYLNREELTQEKFVSIDGERFYRTGDIGRMDAGGNLEILGRSDFQIKLRGIRIELNEIETVLRRVPGVKDGVVAVHPLTEGEKGLVGYVVLQKGHNFSSREIRQFLQAQLPDYMVPAIFMELATIPVNINQKVDRRALPVPTLTTATVNETAYVAPRNSLEESITGIWRSILKLEKIGIYDNFFDLGGHSLMAAQVAYRLQESLKLDVPISLLFKQPTVAALAEDIAATSQSENDSFLAFDVITRRGQTDNLPLSPSQSQMWLVTQLEGGIAYNIPLAFKLVGALHIDALEKSLTETLHRHESLRTIFPVVDGIPTQQILPPQPLPLPSVNLQSLPEEAQTATIYELAQQEAQKPFELAEDLPIRVTLLQLGKSSNVLLLTVHHIVSDGWSLEILQKELAVLYTGFVQGQISPLEGLHIQYSDYVYWQQQWLNEHVLIKQLTYWKKQLADAPPLLELPLDHFRPAAQTFRGGTEFFTLDTVLTRQLKILCQRTGVTLFVTLLAAFATLLSRYSRQQDLVIGSPVANRNRSELETLIGCFINLLALRIDLTGNPTFLELVQRVRQLSLDAYAHQDVPFGQLLEELQPEHDLSYSPVFQVMFVLQNAPVERLNFADLDLKLLNVESGAAKYDLTLMMEETNTGLVANFEYNTDLFNAATIHRMIGHFQTLLEGIVANPDYPIATLPMLTEAERHQLSGWNDTQTDYSKDKCIHQLFEEQVERTPHGVAVSVAQQSLTYQELNQQANQLAHKLRILGIGLNQLVGIYVERTLDMVVAMLAVLKAGGAYVPLDPDYPRDRITYVLDDAQVGILLTQSSLISSLQGTDAQILCLDADRSTWDTQSQENLPNLATPEHLAYVIYTSGSTGNPKGVQIIHSAVVNFLTSIGQEPGMQPEDRLLAVTTLSFDIAVLELLAPLMVGAKVVIASRTIATDGQLLAEELNRSQSTILQATPATWRMLLESGWQGHSGLKMLCGGEALPRELANQLLSKGASLWNMYGPTETTIWSAVSQVHPADAPVYVGSPIANTQFYVLDNQGLSVPIGVSGELYIGGAGLAQGYFNRPMLSQERFIPNPFSSKTEDRLYKTGDLVRYRATGELEFLGRIDNQVKIRGFRIELGEIEATLSEHPAVQQCVVIDREDELGDKRLVAYITSNKDEFPATKEFRQFLKQTLPNYMIPSAFVQLEFLPLTPNGKIDRRALPKPSASDMQLSESYVAPRNPQEQQITDIWARALKLERVGIYDNFFELGGHSLLAVQVFSEIERTWHTELPLSLLFKNPSVCELAKAIQRKERLTASSSLVALQPNGSKTPIFGLHAIGTSVQFYHNLASHLGSDQPFYGLQSRFLDQADLNLKLEDMATFYIEEIKSIQPEGPYLLTGYSFGGSVVYEMAQQLQKSGQKVSLLAIIDAPAPGGYKRLSLQQQILQHWKNFLTQGTRYVIEKTSQQLKFHTFQLRASLKRFTVPRSSEPKSPAYFESRLRQIEALHKQTLSNYQFKEYQGEITLFRSDTRPDNVGDAWEPTLGWSRFAKGGLEIYDIPGDHNGIFQDPNVQIFAEKFHHCIDKALAGQ